MRNLVSSFGSRTLVSWKFILLLTVLIQWSVFISEVESGVASHHHSHRHSSPSPNREREDDGAYSPRGNSHYTGASRRGGSPDPESDEHEHNAGFDHEAILGSTKDAQEFDNLPPEEAKKRLKVLVLKMDLDNNGFIEKQELKAWIIRSFSMLSEEESRDRFNEVDSNEDGRVHWKEYVEENFGVNPDDIEIPLESLEEQKMLRDDKALFTAADKNNDGYLDIKEYLPFSHPEEDPAMLPVIYRQTLDDKDKNGDGEIDFAEFIGDRAHDKDTEWLKEEKSKFDLELDKDGDGLLSRQEILSWVIPSNEEIAEEETAHLFAAADDDQDNRLSYEEIIDHHDIFVGSEATDYGDHLHNLNRFTDEL